MEKKKKKIAIPHTYVLLVVIILVCALLTWFIPAGAYDRVVDEATGRNVVDPASFHFLDDNSGLGFLKPWSRLLKE